jgi:poly-gamma-glutamate synthesis protein (capsule biosynthesis protein)
MTNLTKSALTKSAIKISHAKFGIIALLLAALCLLSACDVSLSDITPSPAKYAPLESTEVNLTLIGAGDNLIHGPIYRQAKERTGGSGFDFTPAYSQIADYISEADLAFINQETPLGGTELGLSSYPMFNSPQEVGTHLIGMGFNLISHANNHVLDAGKRGFFNTIEFWRKQSDVIMAGIAASQADDTIKVLEYGDVRVALLAYTYGTNGLSLPTSTGGIVKYIDDELIVSELEQAREAADIVIVSMHWGVEYQSQPNDEQKRLAMLIAENGANIIIGTHPHVLQTAELLSTSDGREVPVFYSLGNLISAQNKPATMLGGLAEVDMTYDKADGSLTINKMGVIPVVTDYTGNYDNITVYPLAKYTAEQARAHGVHAQNSSFTLDYLKNLFNERIPEEYRDLR